MSSSKMLKDKVAVIYGAAGAVGSTAAHAFAREGARVFLTGRSTSKLNKVAQEISSAGLSVEVAEVDALDEQGVNDHLEKTFEKTGRVEIFSEYGRGINHCKSMMARIRIGDSKYMIKIARKMTDYEIESTMDDLRNIQSNY